MSYISNKGGMYMSRVNNKAISVLARAYYGSEVVEVLDVLGCSYSNKVEYLINYNGPIWVDSSYLTNIVWLIN